MHPTETAPRPASRVRRIPILSRPVPGTMLALGALLLLACSSPAPSSGPNAPDPASPTDPSATAATEPAATPVETAAVDPTPEPESRPKPEQITISIACGSVGDELRHCRDGVAAWEKKTGHKVKILSMPSSAQERLFLYQANLTAKTSDIDVLQIDVIWPGMLERHLTDLRPIVENGGVKHFDAMIETATVGDRLVAAPWFIDAGLLYYRKDLLERHRAKVPGTWAELAATARKIQRAERRAGNKQIWGYVWQGRDYEGLTCNAVEWIASFGGGAVVDRSRRVTVDNPQAAKALKTAASWVGTISPRDVLGFGEEEARDMFQSGNAVFMRNWPYAWPLAQAPGSPVRDKVGVAVLPRGGAKGKPAATLGGWMLAVSKYSRHPELAADLVKHLTSADEQRRRFLRARYNPTIESLYQDQEILAAMPVIADMANAFRAAVPRPATQIGEKYGDISTEFFSTVHQVLRRKGNARGALRTLARNLESFGLSRK